MPTLPVEPERPAGPVERIGMAAQRVSAAIGADARISVRALLALAVVVVCLSFSPQPFQWIGLLAALSLALDWMRTKSRP